MDDRKIDDSEYQFDKKQLGRPEGGDRVRSALVVAGALATALIVFALLTGCAPAEPVEVEVTREVPITQEVTREVPITQEVEVTRVVEVKVTPLPTYTPRYPTNTPGPTNTPRPTKTPLPPTPTDAGPLFRAKGDGTYYVGRTIGTGLWKSASDRESCYWETFDANGNIINNFFGNSGAGQKVHLTDYVYGVEFNGCGTWLYQG